MDRLAHKYCKPRNNNLKNEKLCPYPKYVDSFNALLMSLSLLLLNSQCVNSYSKELSLIHFFIRYLIGQERLKDS